MVYETRQVQSHPPEWEAEAIGEDGVPRTALFTGPDSQDRAEAYAYQMNNAESELIAPARNRP
ncbi:MAG: hypothetical protein ABSG41_26655 [Bryobacteraceae bacterium]|jgi:hypothetical protein